MDPKRKRTSRTGAATRKKARGGLALENDFAPHPRILNSEVFEEIPKTSEGTVLESLHFKKEAK